LATGGCFSRLLLDVERLSGLVLLVGAAVYA